MSVNKERPHVFVIPEDDADRQLAIGFLGHYAVAERLVELRDPAGGWSNVLNVFEQEYLGRVRGNGNAHVVLLIDFDEKIESRRSQVEARIPIDVRPRVFFVGPRDTPEALRRELGMSREKIGEALADDCTKKEPHLWHHAHLVHNKAELERMTEVVRPILFQ